MLSEPVREEERVAAADLKTASASIAASEYRISQANRAMRRNAQNAGDLCEESEPTQELSRLFTPRAGQLGWGMRGGGSQKNWRRGANALTANFKNTTIPNLVI